MHEERKEQIFDGFPERLAELMNNHGVTQAALAEAIGVSPGAVAHFTAGRKYPSLTTLVLICDALNVKLAKLVNI